MAVGRLVQVWTTGGGLWDVSGLVVNSGGEGATDGHILGGGGIGFLWRRLGLRRGWRGE